ncbi:MAG: aldo/keto reductase [Terrestrivirus sp.]|uniref:Aldo/keto reductase n=1 Tax=Terrestrivirus sp. TaxID=2487775 RepID=A0A3G4ZNV5_9VIRU|nr:MAG: aldo/keto reductase [Terrestrivirus sp.]
MTELSNFGVGTYKLLGDRCIDIVTQALRIGYRTIDTAVLYKNHEQIREAIKRSGIPRSELYISSKIHDSDQKSGKIFESVEIILIELGITYLDQLLLHSAVEGKYIESYKQLEKLQELGLVRNIGVSNFRIDELEILLSKIESGEIKQKPFVNQFEVSPFCTRDELVTFCKNHGIKIQAYGSLTVGRKFNDERLSAICTKVKMNPCDLLLQWGLQKGYYLIPKSETEQHLKENFASKNKNNVLDDSIMKELDDLNESYYTIRKHRDKNIE